MRKYFKYVVYLFVVLAFSSANADAYVDYFRAVDTDNASGVAALLARGLDPNTLSPYGQTGLFLAMREESLKVAEVLVADPALQVDIVNAAGETALMVAAPIVTVAWIWLQIRGEPDVRDRAALRTREIVFGSIPASCPEAMTLSVAGYAAIVATGTIDARATAEMLGLTDLAPLAIYIAIIVIIPVLSNCALPPMFSATFLASFLSATPGLDTDPSLVALALIMGWALNLTASGVRLAPR